MSPDPIGSWPRPPLTGGMDTLPTRSPLLPSSGTPPATGTAATPPNTAPRPTASTPFSTVTPAVTTLPASGIDGDTQLMLDTLLDQFSQQSNAPLRVLSAQRWPMELARQVLHPPIPNAAAMPDKLARWLPALLPWLAQQGTWQTRQGTQGFASALYVPGPWLALKAAGDSQASSPTAVRIVTEQPHAMATGALALVLENAEGEPFSALLTLDFGPARHTQTYGRDLFNPRQDPWVQQAVLSAHGPKTRPAVRGDSQEELCQETQCPYFRRAECPQPFCPWHMRVPAIPPTE